jgi:hypothetical protein
MYKLIINYTRITLNLIENVEFLTSPSMAITRLLFFPIFTNAVPEAAQICQQWYVYQRLLYNQSENYVLYQNSRFPWIWDNLEFQFQSIVIFVVFKKMFWCCSLVLELCNHEILRNSH